MANSITKQILDLENKTKEELRKMYSKLYCEEPQLNSKKLLIRKIAYRLQELEYGFLLDKHAKKLETLTDEFEKGRHFVSQRYFKPMRGTKIKRSYNGTDYEVEALEEGFLFEGLEYKSLSAIARKITGTRWNGLKFFGVSQKITGAKMTGQNLASN